MNSAFAFLTIIQSFCVELFEKIKDFQFHSIGDEQISDFGKVIDVIAKNIAVDDLALLRQDFAKFAECGKFVVFNTFSGGIIFLREPEVINNAVINFQQILMV